MNDKRNKKFTAGVIVISLTVFFFMIVLLPNYLIKREINKIITDCVNHIHNGQAVKCLDYIADEVTAKNRTVDKNLFKEKLENNIEYMNNIKVNILKKKFVVIKKNYVKINLTVLTDLKSKTLGALQGLDTFFIEFNFENKNWKIVSFSLQNE